MNFRIRLSTALATVATLLGFHGNALRAQMMNRLRRSNRWISLDPSRGLAQKLLLLIMIVLLPGGLLLALSLAIYQRGKREGNGAPVRIRGGAPLGLTTVPIRNVSRNPGYWRAKP